MFYVPAMVTKVVTVKDSMYAVVGVVLEGLFFNVQRKLLQLPLLQIMNYWFD